MTAPKVSVIIATYRRTESLKKALHSLQGQTFSDFEIILVDDNADSSWSELVYNIVNSFRCDCPNIRITYIVNAQNRGSAESRNIGIKKASGEYITFLDDDDIYLPFKIEHQLNTILLSDADYNITDLMLYNENDQLIDKRVRHYIKKIDSHSLEIYHLKYHLTGTDTFMFKKSFLLSIGCFDSIDVGDEFYLMHKAIISDGQFSYFPGCDVKAYVHTGESGLSSGQSKIDGENTLYKYKSKFFPNLSPNDVQYIKMRHYAVLAFAGLRSKRFIFSFINGFLSVCSSPMDFIKLCLGRKRVTK